MGFDTHWLDAAWFVGGFPNGVGNWFCKPKEFPNGLKPVTDACHATGMKFVLWFEPERVAEGTQIAREHPEFVFGGAKGGLFKLSDPAALRWLTDTLSKDIGDYGLDVYRNDFNMDPLDTWRRNDEPNRQGMTEIRYIEGLYAMWDEFLAKHPGLMIDNCASGGRRIDLEMCMRSIRSGEATPIAHPAMRTGTRRTPSALASMCRCTWPALGPPTPTKFGARPRPAHLPMGLSERQFSPRLGKGQFGRSDAEPEVLVRRCLSPHLRRP